MPSFLAGYGNRKEIRYGTVFPGANLTDFPKLFEITADSDIAAELSGGGGIAVTLNDGTTTVPFGLYPSSAPATGNLILRAKFSPLTAASTGDVMGYLYYDSGQTTTEDKSGTVSNSYVAFMPLEEDPSGSAPQIYDWVTETNVGTSAGSMTSGDLVAAQVANGLDFDGADDSIGGINLSAHDGDSAATFEANVKRTSTAPSGNGDSGFVDVGDASDQGSDTHYPYINGNLYISIFCVNSRPISAYDDSAFNKTVWHHLALTSTSGAGNYKLYRNGSVVTTGTGPSTVSYGTIQLGRGEASSGHFYEGRLDEVRLSSVARSADWLAYTYADEFTNSDTFTLGAQETAGGGGGKPFLYYAMMRG